MKLSQENYLGRYDYDDVTDADIVMTEITDLLKQRKDLMVKGAQLIARYKNSGLFTFGNAAKSKAHYPEENQTHS